MNAPLLLAKKKAERKSKKGKYYVTSEIGEYKVRSLKSMNSHFIFGLIKEVPEFFKIEAEYGNE